MNIERAIEHILHLQAQAEVRMQRADVRMDRAEARMDRAEARMDRMDRQLVGIQKIIRTGMKLIVRIEKSQKESDEKLNALIEAQQRSEQREERLDAKLEKLMESQRKTDEKFAKWLDSLKHRNGKR
jgi:hypothetical protein